MFFALDFLKAYNCLVSYLQELLMTGNQEPAMTKKDFSLNVCQVISALAVMMLHANECFWVFSSNHQYWFSANVIESVFYFAVPVFFMITGITLADYKERYSTKTFFKKRIEKTLIPYIVWSILAVVFRLATGTLRTEDITLDWVIRSLIRTDNIIYYFWFFGALFVFYLLMPLIASIKKEHKLTVFKYLIIILFVVNITFFYILRLYGPEMYMIDSVDTGLGNIIFVFLGYYIYNRPPSTLDKIFIYILAVLGLLTHMVGTYILSFRSGQIEMLFKGYSNFPSILYSVGIFVLLKDIAVKIGNIKWMKKFFEILGKYTFAVYLIHWFIIQITYQLIDINPVSLVYRLLFPLLIYAVIIPVTWCLRKIPVIRKIVP